MIEVESLYFIVTVERVLVIC